MTPTPRAAVGAVPIHTPSAHPEMGLAQRLEDRARDQYERTASLDLALAIHQASDGYVSLGESAQWWQS